MLSVRLNLGILDPADFCAHAGAKRPCKRALNGAGLSDRLWPEAKNPADFRQPCGRRIP